MIPLALLLVIAIFVFIERVMAINKAPGRMKIS